MSPLDGRPMLSSGSRSGARRRPQGWDEDLPPREGILGLFGLRDAVVASRELATRAKLLR